MAGDLTPAEAGSSGSFWINPLVRVGHISQYSVEELDAYQEMTVVEYAERKLLTGKASEGIIKAAGGNVRHFLGAFGLGSNRHAHSKIRHLSGGERMRLCFCTVMADQPNILLLDESTNFVDLETLDSMSKALNDWPGTVFMVSHNRDFLSGFCQELWVLDGGKIVVRHAGTESFDEMFAAYQSEALSGTGSSRASHRQHKATLAKRAKQQRAGARQNTALL